MKMYTIEQISFWNIISILIFLFCLFGCFFCVLMEYFSLDCIYFDSIYSVSYVRYFIFLLDFKPGAYQVSSEIRHFSIHIWDN